MRESDAAGLLDKANRASAVGGRGREIGLNDRAKTLNVRAVHVSFPIGERYPYGMTGARCTGHIMYEGKRRGAKLGVVTMCIGGMGAAGLFEIF